MSIHKLIQQLDDPVSGSLVLKETVEEIIGDYIGVSESYLNLMSTVKN